MRFSIKASILARGQGAKSALVECKDNLDDLHLIIEEAISEWCEEFQGDHEDPDIEWNVEVEISQK